ncbi:hypothetical protein [Amycolatopsis sp. NPDC059657]|uniref:hypothetical protein n=1 Tax=Amycolatopsis sp. NPDC059657 TaxID=3346899 RepID=UPI00366F5ACD
MRSAKKTIAAACLATGLTLGVTAAPAQATEFRAPSLDYQNCPGQWVYRTAEDGTQFKYELKYTYRPNGIVLIGHYSNWYLDHQGDWRYNGHPEYYC